MHETTDTVSPSRRGQPSGAEPPAALRNRHRLEGWMIAVGASAGLWALIVGAAWAIVTAVT